MSAVITTLVLIGIALVLGGFVWYAVKGVLETQKQELESSADCLNIVMKIQSASCSSAGDSCTISVQRLSGGINDAVNANVTVSQGANAYKGSSGGFSVFTTKAVTISGATGLIAGTATVTLIPSLSGGKMCVPADEETVEVA